MGCINNTKLTFATTLTVPKGFYYNNQHQLSFGVSTEDLNLYVAEEYIETDEVLNDCTQEPILNLLVTVLEVRMSGTLFYRLALNALVSSYNFMISTENTVDDGWSSADGNIFIESLKNLEIVDYVVLGYLDPENPVMPTLDNVTVYLESFDVNKIIVSEGQLLEITGEISFILDM